MSYVLRRARGEGLVLGYAMARAEMQATLDATKQQIDAELQKLRREVEEARAEREHLRAERGAAPD
jgi:Skp family chaperone for outer membrane proteins